MADQQEGEDRVSREAHQRMITERDQYKERAEKAEAAVVDFTKRDRVEEFLSGKVANPRTAAEMLLPHLSDVPPDGLVDHLGSDSFAPRLAAFAAPPAPTPEGGTDEPPADPGAGFAGPGPNPGSGGKPPTAQPEEPLTISSPKYQQALAEGRLDDVQKWHDDGLVQQPRAPY